MCGIVGVLELAGRPLAVDRLKPMVDAVAHRGPDDAGYLVWQTARRHRRDEGFGHAFTDREFRRVSPLLPAIDAPEGRECLGDESWDLLLGHRRLAVLDPGPRGHQPMSDPARRTWLSYNGEVYNFRELRRTLEKRGHVFQSRTDTEVVLAAYDEWGWECVERFNGMFALALWDDRRKQLLLARDRYGVKPLYYARIGSSLVFASEVKAILPWVGGRPEVDLLALNEYFSFQNVFTERTLFEGIRLLSPGCALLVDAAAETLEQRRYWSFRVDSSLSEPRRDIEAQLADLLRQAVRRQCVSDVPIGSYLSGGMDSATVAAITAQTRGRILTFTLGFDLSEAAAHEMSFDERERAEQLANLIQTEHYECVLHSGDMENVLRDLVWSLEDLRLGQSYPNYYVARLASKFVKVVMTGVGGDELFGGYPWRYALATARATGDYVRDYYSYWQRLVRNLDKPRLFNADTRERLSALREDGAVPFVDHTFSVFQRLLGSPERIDSVSAQVENALEFECKTFLHGLLVVEDKLSMAHSLESRVPYLDNDLVDFASRIPIEHKVSGLGHLEPMDENLPRRKQLYARRCQSGKDILRTAADRLLPPEFTRAPKQGFSAPDESWFRGRSAAYVRDALLDPTSPLYDYLDPAFVRETVDLHCSGAVNKRLLLWSLLSFQKWIEVFR